MRKDPDFDAPARASFLDGGLPSRHLAKLGPFAPEPYIGYAAQRLGVQLQTYYEHLLREPLPDRFSELLGALNNPSAKERS